MSFRKNGLLSDMLASSKRLSKALPIQVTSMNNSTTGSSLTNQGYQETAYMQENNTTVTYRFYFQGGSRTPTNYQWYYSGNTNLNDTTAPNYIAINSGTYGSSLYSGGASISISDGSANDSYGGSYYIQIVLSPPNSAWSADYPSTFRSNSANPAYKPVTGRYRLVVSNAAGSVTTMWVSVLGIEYDGYECNCLGQNCGCCNYDCNCDAVQVENCCCFDCSGDGITCCDGNPNPENCCRGECDPGAPGYACGYHTEYQNCSTCQDCCYYDCSNDPCDHGCQYTTCDTCWSNSTYIN